MQVMLRYRRFLNDWRWGNRIGKVAKETMMFDLMKVDNIMFCASNIDRMLMIMDFLFHQGEKKDQQGENG